MVPIQGKADIVFISHLVSLEGGKTEKDFYYGSLPSFLEKNKGLTTLTGLIDHTASFKSITEKQSIDATGLHRFLFPKTISFSNELRFAGQCFSSFRKLTAEYFREKDPEKKQILCEAAIHALSPETTNALRIGELIKNILRQTGAGSLVITWEGRSWERLAFQSAHSVNMSIKCIGYQHTVLLASSHALKRSLGKTYDPDILFTIGSTTAAVLRSSGQFTQTEIISFGSYRLSGSAKEKLRHHSGGLTCLVAPEGIETESVLLFGFAIQLAKQLPDMQFVFRTHPVLPYEWLAKKFSSLAALPLNCRLSELADINDDFQRSDILLYRGSSVAIYAALNGLRPVYYAIPGELTVDPLYLPDDWKLKVENADDFIQAITMHTSTAEDTKETQYRSVLSIYKDYVIVPDQELAYRTIIENTIR